MPDKRNETTKQGRLRRRAEFVRVSGGRRWHGRALTLQARERDGDTDEARFGFTLTKKVGNAVVRNRARRRLKDAVRLAEDLPARVGCDYVIVGRIDALRLPFATLKSEIAQALTVLHGAGRKPRAPSKERESVSGGERRKANGDRPHVHGRGAKRIRPEP